MKNILALLGAILLGMFLHAGCTNKDERNFLPITADNVERVQEVLAGSSNFNARDWVHVNAFNVRYGCTLAEKYDDTSTESWDDELWDMLKAELDSTFLIGKTINKIIQLEKGAERERVLLGGVSSPEVLRKSQEIDSVRLRYEARVDSFASVISVEMTDVRSGYVIERRLNRMAEAEISLRVSNNGSKDIRHYDLSLSLKHPSFGGDNFTKYVLTNNDHSIPANSQVITDGEIIFTGVLAIDQAEEFVRRPMDQYVLDVRIYKIEFEDGEYINMYENPVSELQDHLCEIVR